MSLTPEGVRLERRARELLGMASEMEREIQDIKNFRDSELTIGITRSRGAVYLPPVLARFNAEYPGIRLNLFEGSVPEVEEALHQSRIDISIGFRPEMDYNVRSIPFWRERNAVMVPRKFLDQLPKERKEKILLEKENIDLRDLKDCPFIALNPKSQSGKPFYSICRELGMAPNIILEAQTIDVLIALCTEGMGILVCPEIFLFPHRKIYTGEDATAMIFYLGDFLVKEVCINYLNNKYLSIAAKEFVTMIRNENYEFYQ